MLWYVQGEEGEGAVYVYRGSSTFAFTERPQKILPSDVHMPGPVRGFGFSFSPASADVDGNGRADFAVGSLFSGAAVVLRAKEVVRIEPESYKVIPFKAVEPELNGSVHHQRVKEVPRRH